ncbi:MAG: ABC transporter ATP-binding protein/permease [Bacteroidia bacterium]|nr:ABC transporter ATP-binding protein/permease [Bacteroidia bacterium]MCX7652666.1 ABC transporter ATP-binding protein/permease [Bacteroidia bacterium]MDW8416980.1 ABC transporter ATP-binding protein [Bacteroidia bacterium]
MRTALRIFAHGKAVNRRLYVAVLAFFLFNLFNVFSLALIIPFLEILFAQAAEPAPMPSSFSVEGWKKYLFYQLYLFRVTEGPMQALFYFSIAIAIAILLKNAFRYLAAWNMVRFENTVIETLRNRIFAHLTQMPLSFFVRNKKGRLLNLATQDVQVIQEATIGTIYNLLNDPITMLFYLGTMTLLSWKLTVVSLLVLPLTGWMISRLAKTLRRRAHQGQQRMDQVLSILDEFLTGVRTVKAFGAEVREQNRFQTANAQYTRFMTALRRRMELASPLTEVLSVIVVLGLLYYGTFSVLNGSLKASEFITFIAIFGQFLSPMKTFNQALSRLQKAIASFRRIESLLNQPTSAEYQTGLAPIRAIREGIQLESVAFRYGEKEVLRDVSLRIPVGSRVAFVGPSGSGKTTLADLIAGFYRPTAGTIRIDDWDLSEIDPLSYRRLLGIVPQDGMLFHATLLENITYGTEGKVDEQRVWEALEMAQARSFVEELPEGLYTIVGERGQRFSGGQRQRLALARALYRQPQLLILDEATSALDSESEARIHQALAQLPRTYTLILIAHRLSTVRHADWIYVLHEGSIVEEGTHESLLGRGGLYARLYNLQAV